MRRVKNAEMPPLQLDANEFAQNPAVQVIEASAVKEFGRAPTIPLGSVIHFWGDDPEEGPLVRYTLVTRQGTQPSLQFANSKRCARVGKLGVMPSEDRVAADN